ncbi:protein of unknown function [Candidatus Methylocalor cossyra]|uniref:Uncharacterized protein n=1 Tax=Candidatus Methylocalor cossyra TaxID=3108543 RepID=A0ABM9NI56_9GAMM
MELEDAAVPVFFQVLGVLDVFEGDDVAALQGHGDGVRVGIVGDAHDIFAQLDVPIPGAVSDLQDVLFGEVPDSVVAGRCIADDEGIPARTPDHRIVALAADEGVVSGTADQLVVPGAARQGVVPSPTIEDVVAKAEILDYVVAALALERVMAAVDDQHLIVAARANDLVVQAGGDDRGIIRKFNLGCIGAPTLTATFTTPEYREGLAGIGRKRLRAGGEVVGSGNRLVEKAMEKVVDRLLVDIVVYRDTDLMAANFCDHIYHL